MSITIELPDDAIETIVQKIAEAVVARMGEQANARYMNVRETADYLGVSENHVRNLVSSNEIPHKRVGRSVRFRTCEIDAWLDGHR